MIRGAVILAVGFSLGYAKALHESDDIRTGLAELIRLLNSEAQNMPTDTVDGTVTEEGESNE